MKEMIVAVISDTKLTKSQIQNAEVIANQQNGMIRGVVEYPSEILFTRPEIMVNALSIAEIEIVIVANDDFIIHEIITQGQFSSLFNEKGIEIIDINSGKEVNKVYQDIPKEFLNSMQLVIEQFGKYKLKNVLVITQDNSYRNVQYINKIQSEENVAMIAVARIPEYIPEMANEIRGIIKEHKIDKLVVLGDINSKELLYFIEKLSLEGMNVIYS